MTAVNQQLYVCDGCGRTHPAVYEHGLEYPATPYNWVRILMAVKRDADTRGETKDQHACSGACLMKLATEAENEFFEQAGPE